MKGIKGIGFLIVILAFTVETRSETRSLMFGGVEVGLGMPIEDAVKNLSRIYTVKKYDLAYIVFQKPIGRESYHSVGALGAEEGKVTLISRSIDTNRWPSDLGFSFLRALFDALNLAVPKFDQDGAKRTNARIVWSGQESTTSLKEMKQIDLYVDNIKVALSASDFENQKITAISVQIQNKPW